MIWLIVLGAVGVPVLFAVWASNSRWAGERDWVYSRYNPRRRGVGSLGLFEEIYQPSIQYVIEERSSQRARGSQDEAGDRPEPDRTVPESRHPGR